MHIALLQPCKQILAATEQEYLVPHLHAAFSEKETERKLVDWFHLESVIKA